MRSPTDLWVLSLEWHRPTPCSFLLPSVEGAKSASLEVLLLLFIGREGEAQRRRANCPTTRSKLVPSAAA